MPTKAQAALAAYDEIMHKSNAAEYIDTGDALQVMHGLASALRWFPNDEAKEGTNDQARVDEVLAKPDYRNGCADPAHNGNCDEWHEKGSPEREGNLGEVIDRRVQVYGDPITGFTDIAELWSTYLGFQVQPWQVPIMMILMKVARSKTSPDYSDHSDDIEGYLDIFRTLIGGDMIHAKSVNEYIKLKWPADG